MISAVAPLRPNNSDFHLNGAELTTGKRREKGKESKNSASFSWIFSTNIHFFFMKQCLPTFKSLAPTNLHNTRDNFPVCSADNCVTDVTPPY